MPKSEVWNHFEINGRKSICKFCGKEAYKNPSRMPLHLTKCLKCPDSLKQKMLAELPKSVYKNASIGSSHSQSLVDCNSFDIPDIEVVNEEDFEEKEVFLPDKHRNCSRNSDEPDISFTQKLYEKKLVDEFTLFGNSVAHKLRNINNPRARVVAQYYINTVLFRAEMTNFNQDVTLPAPQEFTLFDTVNEDNAGKEDRYKPPP